MRRPLLIAALALVLAACGVGPDPGAAPGPSSAPAPDDTIVVASANFTESRILAAIYHQALTAKGIKAELTPPAGRRETYFPALQDGSFDLIPEYTGVLLQFVRKDAPETEPEAVYTALQAALPPTLMVLDKSAAEDKDAVVVTRETATRLKVRSIAELAPHCGSLVFGGPPEFQSRPDGIPGIQKTYDCAFREYRSLDAGTLTVDALKAGTVQAANIFTTDASIATNDFVVLEDPRSNFAAQNVVPLINREKATDQVRQVLNAISARLTTAELTRINAEAAADAKPGVATVARNWLAANNLG